MELTISKFVSEVYNELENIIDENHKVLIEAPTESGKSYFVKKYIENNPNKHIVFAIPTKILVDNLGKNEEIKSGYGKEFLHSIKEKESIITTYDSLECGIYKKNIPDIVFIDEAHFLAGQGKFRRIIETILTLETKVVLISGTPEIIELLPDYKKVTIKSKNRHHRECNIYLVQDQPKTTARNIINKTKSNVLKIIRLNSKEKIQELYDEYNKTKQCAIYHSTNNANDFTYDEILKVQKSELTEQIKVGVIPENIDILFTTSIIDAGLTLKVYREVDFHVISNDKRKLPNAIDVCQIAYRVRTNQGISNLNIYGNFGNDELEESLPTPKKIKHLIAYMSLLYDSYEELREDIYQGVLSHYGVHSHITILDKTPTFSQSRISEFTIAKNLRSYPDLWELLKNRCSKKNIEKLNGTKNINGKGDARAKIITKLLIKANLNKIDFDIFLIKGKFEKKRLNNLMAVKDIYRNINSFAVLVDSIIECYLDEKVNEFKINNKPYFELIKNEQEIFKEFVKLIFEAPRFDRNTLKLNRKKCDEAK